MKIKLGSVITEAKGKIGGHYVGSWRGTKTISRKRSRSGQAKLARATNYIQLQNYSRKWNTIGATARKTWTTTYGSQLKGFREYVRQAIYRTICGATVFSTVQTSDPENPLSVVGFTYTEATQSITVTLGGNGTTVGSRVIQIRNYSATRSVKGNSGWWFGRQVSATTTTPISLTTAITNTGRKITNNTTFQIRVIQALNNMHPVTISTPFTIKTGA